MKEYPMQYKVNTMNRTEIPLKIKVEVPGSKSMTNRALLLATLADGQSILKGVLFSDDSRYFMKCVQELGFSVNIDEENHTVTLMGNGSEIPKSEASIYVGSAGTAARFLTALLGISKGRYVLDASGQMRKRPMAPLLQSLRELGADIVCTEKEGFFPFVINSTGVDKQEIAINIDDSSQFLSALLISCCRTGRDFRIHVNGSHGMAYIDMTTRMMEEFGVHAIREERAGRISYLIPGNQGYRAREYRIEPDVSAACYFYALAMLLGTEVTVAHVNKDTLQGDIKLLDVLCEMGGTRYETEDGIALKGPENGQFHGVTVDMHAFSDQALTLAVLAPFADSPTTITGIGHIRGQECDRIAAILNELGKLGIYCEELEDGVKIYPSGTDASGMNPEHTIHGGVVTTYDDHRVAMSFTLIGLRVPGIVIDRPECCRKTFETYYDVLEKACRRLIYAKEE